MLKRKTETCSDCEKCNNKSPLFQLLSREELVMMNTGRFELRFNKGETIVKQGTHATYLISLTGGMAKLYLEGFDNKNILLDILQEWRLFGGPGLFTDARYHYSVVAITECTACFIPIDNIRQAIRSNADFAEGLIKHCNNNSVNNFERLVSLTQKQMHGRLADVLLFLSNKLFKADHFVLPVSRQELGEMSNMTKESVTRILKELESDGIIALDTKHVRILNKASLEDLSIRA
ncbi:MAG TPA: Crp/Fnr family transcriptional regulator [Bacteroidales bacterium]|nr:Crp/Fnr family transcriptional regulator [Bacteroidales bacterium]